MSRIRGRDTQPELVLRRALWAAGIRGWRLHPKRVVGCPDLAWPSRRLAVFVDGAFWHGHPDYYHGQSGPFWDQKIGRNRERDAEVDRELEQAGWRVLRLWDFEVERNVARCVSRIAAALEDREATSTQPHQHLHA